ncbi:MAG TPA: hypothetical protein VM818_23025 [Vicinamibacterales bacterium]|jgi:hypothetical protein|nr:hypothetical protein [Vicinamibacterales bacterium]
MRKQTREMTALGVGLIVALLVVTDQPARAQAKHLEQFSAFAVNLQGAKPGDRSMSGVLQITIDRWSSEMERNELIESFTSKGQNGLLNKLEDMKPTGYIKLPTTLGYDLRFAREIPLPDGGRRIILATDRRMTAQEVARGGLSLDYPFTIIELRVNKANMGEGRLSAFTRIQTNKKEQVIELENWGDAPAKLTEVKPLQ